MNQIVPKVILMSVVAASLQAAGNAPQSAPAYAIPPGMLGEILAPYENASPAEYPDDLVAFPTAYELSSLTEDELLALLGHWHPQAHRSAAQELVRRDVDVDPILTRFLHSDSYYERAGGLHLLTTYVGRRGDGERGLASQKWVPRVVELAGDEHLVVRWWAFDVLKKIGRSHEDAARAAVRLTSDPYRYLRSDAARRLNDFEHAEMAKKEFLDELQ